MVEADVSLVKPLPCTKQFEKSGHAVPPSLSETTRLSVNGLGSFSQTTD
jgi:hypothetical protein